MVKAVKTITTLESIFENIYLKSNKPKIAAVIGLACLSFCCSRHHKRHRCLAVICTIHNYTQMW